MYKLYIAESAQQDLDSIIAYIAEKLCNAKAATDFVEEVEKCYMQLKTNPFVYPKCSDAVLERKNYRKAIIKNYLLVFSADKPKSRCISADSSTEDRITLN